MENYKYKEAGNGYFFKIFLDGNGNEVSRTASFNQGKPGTTAAGYWSEMQAWIKAGGVVEPQFTAEELAAKEAEEAQAAIDSTKALCIKYLDETEKHVSSDPPYPDDVDRHKADRAKWREIIKSGTAQDVPEPYKG